MEGLAKPLGMVIRAEAAADAAQVTDKAHRFHNDWIRYIALVMRY